MNSYLILNETVYFALSILLV